MANILVVTYWSLNDALVQTYTLPYLRIIREVTELNTLIHLVTLENDPKPKKELEKGIVNIQLQYDPFSKRAIWNWIKKIKHLRKYAARNKIEVIHTWCTPAGAIGYLVAKKLNLPLILDSYEPHAESMVENGTWQKGGLAFKILFGLERKQSRYAKTAIGLVSEMENYARKKYNAEFMNFFVKPACVETAAYEIDETKEQIRAELGIGNEVVCVYAGKFGGIYLSEEVIEFLCACESYWNNDFKALILTNEPISKINELCTKVGYNPENLITTFVPHNEIPRYLKAADFAINPVKPVPTKRYCTSIKDTEYWASGLPLVITPNIADDSELVQKEKIGIVVSTFQKEVEKDAFSELNTMIRNIQVSGKIKQLVKINRSFDIARDIYCTIYSS